MTDTALLPAPGPVDRIADGLLQDGWAACDGFFDAALTSRLRGELNALRRGGRLRPAAVGRGSAKRIDRGVRGDWILWFDAQPLTDAQQAFLRAMDELRLAINGRLYLGLFDLECHYAVYPRGSAYRRHLDRHHGRHDRVISVVSYLNRDWRPEHEGMLRLYPDAGHREPVDIAPREGTLACFLSDRIWHEVLPTRRDRLSITGWFRRRPLGTTLPRAPSFEALG